MSRVMVILAPGFEEIEATTVIDVLRRAKVEVEVAGLEGEGPCRGSRGMTVVPDRGFEDDGDDFDLVVLPGGMGGAEAMAAHDGVLDLLRRRHHADRPVAAICAAPLVLDRAGVLPPGRFTCYPTVAGRLKTSGRREERVVDAGAVITSQGPATAMDFALHLVARLRGEAVRRQVAEGLLSTV
jgi:protein DJ-1